MRIVALACVLLGVGALVFLSVDDGLTMGIEDMSVSGYASGASLKRSADGLAEKPSGLLVENPLRIVTKTGDGEPLNSLNAVRAVHRPVDFGRSLIG